MFHRKYIFNGGFSHCYVSFRGGGVALFGGNSSHLIHIVQHAEIRCFISFCLLLSKRRNQMMLPQKDDAWCCAFNPMPKAPRTFWLSLGLKNLEAKVLKMGETFCEKKINEPHQWRGVLSLLLGKRVLLEQPQISTGSYAAKSSGKSSATV